MKLPRMTAIQSLTATSSVRGRGAARPTRAAAGKGPAGLSMQSRIVEGEDCPPGYTRCGAAFLRDVEVEGAMFPMEMEHVRCCNDTTEICAPDPASEGGGRCLLISDIVPLPAELGSMIAGFTR